MAKKRLEHDDLQMMKEADRWPRWPVLPLKRHLNGKLEVAFLYEPSISGKPKPVLHMTDIYTAIGKKLDEIPQKEYESFEAAIADGWVVD